MILLWYNDNRGERVKKYIKIMAMLIISVLLTGCIKENQTMIVKKDGSMDLVWIIATVKDIESSSSMLEEEQIKDYKKMGYTVEPYETEDYKGVTLKLHINSIDDVSTLDAPMYKLTQDVPNPDLLELFQLEDRLFVKKYKASYNVATSDTEEEKTSEQMEAIFSAIKMYGGELVFNLEVPYKITSSNATTINSEQTKASWDYLMMEDSTIDFEFIMYNQTAFLFAGIIGILLLLVFLSNITLKIKNKQLKRKKETVVTEVKEESSNLEAQPKGQPVPRTAGKFFGQALQNQPQENNPQQDIWNQ